MRSKRILNVIALLTLLATVLGGCANSVGEASVAKSSVSRNTTPEASSEDLATLVKGNSAFAFDLYQAIRGKSGNLFYAPQSISTALAMTYAGASGQTETQMAETLHFTLSQARLHAAMNSLDRELTSRGTDAKGQDDQGFRLKIANSVWGQTGYQFVSGYLDVLAKNYGAGLQLADFQKSPEPSRTTINQWVKDKTEGKIVDLLPQGTITTATRLVLANAVYFNAGWKYPFDSDSTKPGYFFLGDGSKLSVPMMKQSKILGHGKGQGYEAVNLPYDGDEISMVVIMPDAGTIEQFEKMLSAEKVNNIVNGLEMTNVDLTIPKFAYSADLSLTETLKNMGMTDAVTPGQADFSGISGNRDLYISDVIHKAIVAVNEKGTEAAGATAAIVGLTAMPSSNVTFTVDHPFVFLIRDVKTGTILFMGRVMNPAS